MDQREETGSAIARSVHQHGNRLNPANKPAVVSAPAIRNGRIKLEVTVLGSSYPHQKKKSDSDVKLLEAFCFFSWVGKNRVETEHKYIHQDN